MPPKNRLLSLQALLLFVLTACSLFGRAVPAATPAAAVGRATATSEATTAASTSAPSGTPLPPTATPTTAIPKPLTASVIKIPAPSLEGNLVGEPTEQAIKIYLPPSYNDSNLRYPVVYFLPGYGSGADADSRFFNVDQIAGLIAAGQLSEMILVVPNGANVLHGSFYTNSPVTGNWEDFIARDVVGYIDANYRTIAGPEGRGIGGHSMGGYGALTLAMHHPDVFSAAYCLSSAFFDQDGLGDSMMFDKENKPARFLEELAKLADLPEEEAIRQMKRSEGPFGFTLAYGAAFAPNPELGPPFIDYPYEMVDGEAERIPEVWKRWENGIGGWEQKIPEYHDNLAKLRGIVIDYGKGDRYPWIPPGSEYVSAQLTAAGIPNQIYRFEGDHGDRLNERLVEIMLPFFDRVLAHE